MEKDGNTHNCQAQETRILAYGVSVDVSASPWAGEMGEHSLYIWVTGLFSCYLTGQPCFLVLSFTFR